MKKYYVLFGVALGALLASNGAYATTVSTTISIAATATSINAGSSDTFTATITDTASLTVNEGDVQFTDNGLFIGSPVAVTNGVASFTTTTLPLGSNMIEASYSDPSMTFANSSIGGIGGVTVTVAPVPSTPLPAALPLFATGVGALGLLGWRRKRKSQAIAA